MGGVGGKQELQREVLGRRAGAGLRRPGVGGPQGAAEPRSTSQRPWSGLTRLRWPPAQLVPGGPSCSSPQLGLSWGPGPLLGLPLVPGCVSWEGPAPPSGLALTCPPGELAGSVHPWPAGQGRTQWLAPAFWSSAMACPGWMSARRRSLHPAVLLGLREGEGSEGPGSPPYFRRRPCSEPWLLLRFSDRGPSSHRQSGRRRDARCHLAPERLSLLPHLWLCISPHSWESTPFPGVLVARGGPGTRPTRGASAGSPGGSGEPPDTHHVYHSWRQTPRAFIYTCSLQTCASKNCNICVCGSAQNTRKLYHLPSLAVKCKPSTRNTCDSKQLLPGPWAGSRCVLPVRGGSRRVVKTGLPRDVQRREGINGAKRLKTQRRIQGGVDQRPRAESPQTRGSSEQEESVCVSRGRGLSPGAEGGAPCVCGRAGVGGEGHTPCRGRLCLPTEWVCLGSTPLPGGRHPQMDGGVHVVLDMETELGTDPRTSSHGEQRSQGWAS